MWHFFTNCKRRPGGKFPAMIKRGVSTITWGMCAVILAPSLNTRLFWSSLFSPWNETPSNKSEAELGLRIPNSSLSILCFFWWLSLILLGKYSNHMCLTLLPVSFKHQSLPPATCPPTESNKVYIPTSLIKKKKILAKQRTSHFYSSNTFCRGPCFFLSRWVYIASGRGFSRGKKNCKSDTCSFALGACSGESGAWSR